MGGRYREILLAFCIITVPMVVFSGLLLGLVFHFRVVHNEFISKNLSFTGVRNEPNVIYVKISATTLTTVASWSSTVAPILVGFVISLVSYPVARRFLVAVQNNQAPQLPTPYQLSLILRMLASGGPASLWHWVSYTIGWKSYRESQPGLLKTMVSILFTGLIISILVFATDTWLHFTTKTVNFTQVTPNATESNLSYILSPNCTNINSTFEGGCTLNPAATAVFVLNGPTVLKVLGNISDTINVQTIPLSDGLQYAYIGNTPHPQFASIDYSAQTWAVQSSCTPVTSECMDSNRFSGPHSPFDCTFAFQGTLQSNPNNDMVMAYFTDSTGSNNDTVTSEINNPYYFAAALSINQNTGRVNISLQDDPQIAIALHGATVLAVFCNATVYDVEYSSVNGTVTRFITTPSNVSTTNIIQGTQQYSEVGNGNLLQAASIAGFSGTAKELADQFAIAYSQVAIGAASGMVMPQPALEAQQREDMLVARVPKAPLACLVLSNLLLVVLGTVLTVFAFISVRGETGEVQARLSIPALVAERFGGRTARQGARSVEALFDEKNGARGPRIGVTRSVEGGYSYEEWHPA